MKEWFVFLLACNSFFLQSGRSDQVIFGDTLENNWVNYSWATTWLANPTPAKEGTLSVAITNTAPWQAFYVHHDALSSAAFSHVSFWIHGGPTGGQNLQLQGLLAGQAQAAFLLPPLPTNAWQEIIVPLSVLGVANRPDLDGFWIQDRKGTVQPVYFLDGLRLIGETNALPTPSIYSVTIDATRNRHAISEQIYGVAIASETDLNALNSPLNRQGGNNTSRYNWQLNADNRAADYFFESLAYPSAVPGEVGDSFVAASKAAGAQPQLTIPMVGWVAKLANNRNRLVSFSVAKYGPQIQNDAQWYPDAGNGIGTNSQFIRNDFNDANVPATSAFQQGWMEHLVNRWGRAAAGGLRYYILDNEPSLWHSTHRDVHPSGATLEEVRDKMIDYAARIKMMDPSAQVMGPEEWGWSGYFYSGFDQQALSTNGYRSAPDRAAHGNKEYLPWLLEQLHQRSTTLNQRLLDVFTVHYYPQGGEFGSDTSSSMQLRRNRSTRSLWDTNYVDETWINDKVQLVPRLKNWVKTFYPGTRIGVTEYNWGAENHINGATAQADVLGIFGREGLDVANRWTTPKATEPTFKAIQMYRNYDGKKSTFGDVSLFAGGPNPDNLAVFAAQRSSDQALTLMLVHKDFSQPAKVQLQLTNTWAGGSVQAWRLEGSNGIRPLPSLSLSGNSLPLDLPPQSITLLVLPALAPRLSAQTAAGSTHPVTVRLEGVPGARYQTEVSTNLVHWEKHRIDTLPGTNTGTQWQETLEGPRYFRTYLQL